ncbi:MAG: ABC transporter substrate-binding protein [Alteromonadaceae bacterium]|nr:ABC transporter substrate-binding protein [Alteromonadaceae bacterium]
MTELSTPGSYQNNKGQITGATVEMVRELLRRVNHSGNISIYPWARAYKTLLDQDNIALFETARTKEREKLFKWVGPIKKVSWGFYAIKNKKIHLNSLNEAKEVDLICTYNNDYKSEFLKKHNFENLILPTRPLQCLKMLMLDRVSLITTTDIALSSLAKKAGIEDSELTLVYTIDTYYLYIALSKNVADEKVLMWQQTLDKMKQDGTFEKYYQGIYPSEMIHDINDANKQYFP